MGKSLALWVEGSNATYVPSQHQGAEAEKHKALQNEDPKSTPDLTLSLGDSSNAFGNEIELHINYWLLQEDTGFELNYLDVGVKFGGIDSQSSINIYFPFKVNGTNYYPGLGSLVCSRSDLIQTIFNSTYASTTKASNTSVDIAFRDDDVLRFHTQIDLAGENGGVTVKETGEGSTLSFPLSLFTLKESEEKNLAPNYFRFRIQLERDKCNISQVHKHSDRYILNRLESIEIVDFRLNEVRDLPGVIQSKNLIDSGIRNIHFFLIREVNSEYKQSHADYKRCRLLERELWDDYLNPDRSPSKKIPEQMLIYHWKESSYQKDNTGKVKRGSPIEKFTAFAKFGKITVTKGIAIRFAGVALALGAFAGLFGNLITSLVVFLFGFLCELALRIIQIHFN